MVSTYLHETITRTIHGADGLLYEIEHPAPKRTSADFNNFYMTARAQLTTLFDFLDALSYSGQLDAANYKLYADEAHRLQNEFTRVRNEKGF